MTLKLIVVYMILIEIEMIFLYSELNIGLLAKILFYSITIFLKWKHGQPSGSCLCVYEMRQQKKGNLGVSPFSLGAITCKVSTFKPILVSH